MYKLLIVDDEPLIREGLAASFDWASVGFTVSGTAANGEDAYVIGKIENSEDKITIC